VPSDFELETTFVMLSDNYPAHIQFDYQPACEGYEVQLQKVQNVLLKTSADAKEQILAGTLKSPKLKFQSPTLTGIEHDSELCSCVRNAWY
jgi:hypothetical protein